MNNERRRLFIYSPLAPSPFGLVDNRDNVERSEDLRLSPSMRQIVTDEYLRRRYTDLEFIYY